MTKKGGTTTASPHVPTKKVGTAIASHVPTEKTQESDFSIEFTASGWDTFARQPQSLQQVTQATRSYESFGNFGNHDLSEEESDRQFNRPFNDASLEISDCNSIGQGVAWARSSSIHATDDSNSIGMGVAKARSASLDMSDDTIDRHDSHVSSTLLIDELSHDGASFF